MSQHPDRNYADTGASESGSGAIWARIDRDNTQFLFGKDKLPRNWITAYLDGVELTWKDKMMSAKGNNIPAHAEFVLKMSMKDDVLGTATEEGAPRILNFKLAISSSDRTIYADLLNVLAAMDITWNGWMRFGLYQSDNEKKTLRLKINTSPAQLDSSGKSIAHPPTKFPWDTVSNKGFVGVPGAVDTGYVANGFKVLDWRAYDSCWARVAEQVCQRYNGSAPVCPFDDFNFGIAPQQPTTPVQNVPPVPPPPGDKVEEFRKQCEVGIKACKTGDDLAKKATAALQHGQKIGIFTPAFTMLNALTLFQNALQNIAGELNNNLVLNEDEIPVTVTLSKPDSLPF